MRQAIAFSVNGPLWLDKGIEDIGPGLPGFAATQTEWDVVSVVLQVERPDAGRAQVPAFFQVVDDERLEGGGLDVRAVRDRSCSRLDVSACAQKTGDSEVTQTKAYFPNCFDIIPPGSLVAG